jgi:phage terminase small subunit
MEQRGRKSAAELDLTSIDVKTIRLEPPSTLSQPERDLFQSIVGANDARHFNLSDMALLRAYVQASVLSEKAAAELRKAPLLDNKPSPWLVVSEKAVRAMVALSARLRLSPQSRLDPKTVARRHPHVGPAPWWNNDDEIDD